MADQNQPPSSEPTTTIGPPHDALFLVLPYLPVLELLTVARVCSSLRAAVENDVLPWLHLVVERPLSWRLSDQRLIGISSKAKGRLKSLILVDCIDVSHDGLQWVVSNNPLIDKLHLPGCIRLTAEGIIRAVKTLSNNSSGNYGLKSLHIRYIPGINKQHFQTLCSYLLQPAGVTAMCDLVIDVEICPICDGVGQVYACRPTTAGLAAEKSSTPSSSGSKECSRRGCKLCVPRCEECGRCANCTEDGELEEVTLCSSEVLCTECWLRLPKCNHCNQPYCTRHAYRQQQQQGGSGGGAGWLCEVCLEASEGLEHDDDD